MRLDPERRLDRDVRRLLREAGGRAMENLAWLRANMPPFFFITMQEEAETVATLCLGLSRLASNRQLVLIDREREFMAARLDVPGSLYRTLQTLQPRDISYAEMAHSYAPVPGTDHDLEFQRFEFDRKSDAEVASAGDPEIPAPVRRAVYAELRRLPHPPPVRERDRLLRILWLNNEGYVRISPPRRVARILWLLHQGRSHAGMFLDAETEPGDATEERRETRVLFAVGNPPQRDYLAQVMEVFNRLNLGVRRAYALTVSTGVHPYFLGTFYVKRRDGGFLEKESDLFRRLRRELYNTQILATESRTYKGFVLNRLMTGEEASLVNAFIGFCHTNLAHNQPHRYTLEDVMRAFHTHPDVALKLTRLFELRFDPDIPDRETAYRSACDAIGREIEEYNTGHNMLDVFRRSVFRAALSFIRRTLKTNFFVPEKQALAFRLDPAYLADLGPDFTSDLPPERPFRVTFFYGRQGLGYHIGFSDIARGGWRTIFTKTRDDYVTVANFVFRENYVLAHTQHLKNKDIYEGGSKMVVVVNAPDLQVEERTTQRLFQLQYGFLHAFLDIFVTENGRAKDPRVVDYYGEDEPIELGPDENMRDEMIELIAETSRRRGYLLGIGIISSKNAGINHKRYGVTSTGVVAFAGITMRELGIDILRDPFTVKFTGGPNGDVAGNAMRILLSRCPGIGIRLILDGTGALYDPNGADRQELSRIVLRDDIEAFDPARLSPGGFLLCRNVRRREGLRELFRRFDRTPSGVEEQWVTTDEFYREFDGLLFTVPADLFLPSGGRPETINGENWTRFLREDGTPTARAIVEGANSFLTPEARARLQERGVVILRDASANKCGVISSSYEIIANLLMTEKEFLAHKEAYIADVLSILEKRAEDEANLIFRRRREAGKAVPCTEISDAISVEINRHYATLFDFFQRRQELCRKPPYRNALLAHLPRFLRDNPNYRRRVSRLPGKYRSAILASEIASTIVYRGGFERNFEEDLKGYLSRTFGAGAV
ncbi:MAG TPA: NAD-glutamate dehydrogenase domain-containing protein [Candidatus Deferrimicrobiaceae bacterium]|nr:NAD-glutamate dehydrogenase domain-containing protein [Candidatus Deferrimicrobiaceae bacterium]